MITRPSTACWTGAARQLGLAASWLVNTLDPRAVLLGGTPFAAGAERFLASFADSVRQERGRRPRLCPDRRLRRLDRRHRRRGAGRTRPLDAPLTAVHLPGSCHTPFRGASQVCEVRDMPTTITAIDLETS